MKGINKNRETNHWDPRTAQEHEFPSLEQELYRHDTSTDDNQIENFSHFRPFFCYTDGLKQPTFNFQTKSVLLKDAAETEQVLETEFLLSV